MSVRFNSLAERLSMLDDVARRQLNLELMRIGCRWVVFDSEVARAKYHEAYDAQRRVDELERQRTAGRE